MANDSKAAGGAGEQGTGEPIDGVDGDPVRDAERMADDVIALEKRAADKAAEAARFEAELEAAPALTKSQIVGADDMPTKWVLVPGWGGKVLVRALSGTERDFFESAIVTMRGKNRVTNTENIRAKLCQLAIVDPADADKRRPMFTRKEIDTLGKKSAAALDLIYTEAAKLSGLSNEDVEELAGNSEAGSGGSSSS